MPGLGVILSTMRGLALVLPMVAAWSCSGSSGTDPPPGDDCLAPRAALSGEGTYYDADGTGNCGFDADPGLMVAALNAVDYDDAAWCGACVAVSGPDGEVVVRIVDQCPECKHGDLDLSVEAFAKIAPISAGRVPITWHEVACDVSGPISYQFKDGSNPYWVAIQIRDHRYPIAKLEARDGGEYVAIDRVDYNYFVREQGLGEGPFDLRVTDTRGQVLEDSGIALGDAVIRQGASQFPVCP
ncbi:MAG: expansin EXLX1 family cellulose-binding protein [Kofleriaceae bacterium]